MIERTNRGVVTAVLTTGLALAAVARQAYLVPALLAVAIVVFATGWPRLVGLPVVRGPGIVIALAGLASLGLVTWRGELGIVAPVVGLTVLAAFVAEMLRRDGRPRLVESVAGTVTGAVIVVAAVGWVAIGDSSSGLVLIVTTAATLAVASACTALPLRPQLVATLATLTAGAGGLAVGLLLTDVGTLAGLLIGLAAGILTSAVHLVFRQFPSSARWLPALAAAVLPLLLAGAPAYLVDTLLLG